MLHLHQSDIDVQGNHTENMPRLQVGSYEAVHVSVGACPHLVTGTAGAARRGDADEHDLPPPVAVPHLDLLARSYHNKSAGAAARSTAGGFIS